MKCKRWGCPTTVRGPAAFATVFDERRIKKNRFGDTLYTKPHTERWCLKCYEKFEAHKYTLVIHKPKFGDGKISYSRVIRTDGAGKVVELPSVAQPIVAPIDETVPEWAVKPEASEPEANEIEAELIIPKPKPKKKASASKRK